MSDHELLGSIVRLQVQREPLKATGVYRPDPILAVPEMFIGADGALGSYDGSWVVDAHHALHPRGRGGGRRALSIGFTAHYGRMKQRFGAVPDGIAGENILVDCKTPIRIDALEGGLIIRRTSGDTFELHSLRVAAPCVEFTSFLLGLPEVARRNEIRADLEFLGGGTRGFIAAVDHLARPELVATGDEVYRRV